jgi:hypothetical protein
MNTLLTLISIALLSSNMPSSSTIFARPAAFNINTEVKHLALKAPELNKKVLKLALVAYQKASDKGAVKKPVLTVIDYSLPSSKQRMWIFKKNYSITPMLRMAKIQA